MTQHKVIARYEHQRLHIGEEGFSKKHFDALCKLNQAHEGRYFEIGHRNIMFAQYVGILQVDGLSIEIHPKADKDEDGAPWKNVLLQMLKETGRLKPSAISSAQVKRQHLNLLELYFELYLQEVQRLIHHGLVKRYRKRTSNSLALKGRLEFAGNIQKNLIHKERFYTTHTIYDHDHLLHRMIAHALDIVEQLTRGTWLYDRCKRVLLDFPVLEKRIVSSAEINAIRLDRKTLSYQRAFELARLIILNYSPDISAGKEKMFSLLFDMNQLWEEYVLKMLRDYVSEQNLDYDVVGQDSKRFWKSNSLKPDIVLKHKLSGQKWIIDTKWKRPSNSSASVSDLRQMYAYNRFWSSRKAMLLYPGNPEKNLFHPFSDGEDNSDNLDNQCKMEFAHVLDNEGQLDSSIGQKVFNLIIDTSSHFNPIHVP